MDMIDIVDAYNEQQSERQGIARSSRNGRARRSKRSACDLPNEYLSRKEKMALNGECVTLDLKRFYTWAEFKKLPLSLQTEYIRHLTKKYHVGLATVDNELFGSCHSGKLYQHLKKRGVDMHSFGPRANHTQKEYREGVVRLREDVAIARANEEAADHSVPAEKPEVPEENPVMSGYARFFSEGTAYELDDKANAMFIRHAQVMCNSLLKARGYLSLAEVYKTLGLEENILDAVVGWRQTSPDDYVEITIPVQRPGVIAVDFDPLPQPLELIRTEPVVLKPEDISFGDGPESTETPQYESPFRFMDFEMDRFEIDALERIASLFNGRKVSVSIRIKVED